MFWLRSGCLTSKTITCHDISLDVMLDPSLLVLSSLAECDKHGYAIMMDVETFTGIHLGPGTLYGAITRLEEGGGSARSIRMNVGDPTGSPQRAANTSKNNC